MQNIELVYCLLETASILKVCKQEEWFWICQWEIQDKMSIGTLIFKFSIFFFFHINPVSKYGSNIVNITSDFFGNEVSCILVIVCGFLQVDVMGIPADQSLIRGRQPMAAAWDGCTVSPWVCPSA